MTFFSFHFWSVVLFLLVMKMVVGPIGLQTFEWYRWNKLLLSGQSIELSDSWSDSVSQKVEFGGQKVVHRDKIVRLGWLPSDIQYTRNATWRLSPWNPHIHRTISGLKRGNIGLFIKSLKLAVLQCRFRSWIIFLKLVTSKALQSLFLIREKETDDDHLSLVILAATAARKEERLCIWLW